MYKDKKMPHRWVFEFAVSLLRRGKTSLKEWIS